MKKKNYYLRALIIYIVVLALILGAGIFVLNRFLISYEASRPDNAMESYMESHDRDYFLAGLQKLISAGFNEFTLTTASPTDFGMDEAGELTWRSAGGTDSEKYYEVRLGSAKILSITMGENEDVGFGMKNWTVTGEEFHIPGVNDITVSVPSGCTASINGIEVGSSYVSGVGTVGVELAHSFDKAPDSEIYVIKNMLGPAEITAVDPYGNELEPVFISDKEIEFHPEPTCSFSFYALPGAEVSINGSDISGQYCTPIGSELGVEILRYECDDLYTEPQISVSADGKGVTPARLHLGSFFVPDASPVVLDEEMSEFLEGFIYAYVDFAANKNDSAQANFAVLSRYLLPESELYTVNADSIENIAWAATSGLTYNSIDYTDLIPLGGGKYLCNIHYDISYTLGANDLDVKTTHSIVIETVDGRYYVAEMGTELKG